MEMPWPLPYVLLVNRTPEVPPPQVKSSSPTLMLQFWTRMFVPLTSHASVFFAGGFASDGGDWMVTPCTVMLPLLLLKERWNSGELESVTFWINWRRHP